MNNLFPPHRGIHQTFDLKGSTIGRDYKEAHLADNLRATSALKGFQLGGSESDELHGYML